MFTHCIDNYFRMNIFSYQLLFIAFAKKPLNQLNGNWNFSQACFATKANQKALNLACSINIASNHLHDFCFFFCWDYNFLFLNFNLHNSAPQFKIWWGNINNKSGFESASQALLEL